MAARENRSAVGLGKGKTMHETNGVELATARLASDVTAPLCRKRRAKRGSHYLPVR
jgi:hypothetical protein